MSKPNGNSVKSATGIKYYRLNRDSEPPPNRRFQNLLIPVSGFLILAVLYLAFNEQFLSLDINADLLAKTRAKINASLAPRVTDEANSTGSDTTQKGTSTGTDSTDSPRGMRNDSTGGNEMLSTLPSRSSSVGELSTNLKLSTPPAKVSTPAFQPDMTKQSTSALPHSSFHPRSISGTFPRESSAETGRSVTPTEASLLPRKITPAAALTPISESDILQRPVPGVASNTSNIYDSYAIYTAKCRIRDYDFNDTEVLKHYFSGKIAHCKEDAKPFVFYPKMNLTRGSSCVGFDAEISKTHYNATANDWKCIYKELIRGTKHKAIDRHFDYGKTNTLLPEDCPPVEYLWIQCEMKYNEKLNYTQPLLLPLVKPAAKNLRHNNLGKKPLNVLVVGMDSVSRLNAHRNFPATLKFLQTKKNLVELFGYNKIGLNSAPNQLPLLTGIKYPGKNLHARVNNNYFDNETRYIWDDFESRGYRTMFYEEQWKYGLFIYPSSDGFKEVPTTYWPRPLFQATDWSDLKDDGYQWCIGPDFPAKQYLEYTLNTFRILGSDRPLFSYSWLSEIAHNDVNGGIRADGYFLDFFKNMDKYGLLNNTAVFFISDHGFRFGSFRQTELGRYEDMLPYGYVLMPDSYHEQYPESLANLRANGRRLVTVYDLHATMLELADAWDEDRTVRTGNGYSLLSNIIPEERNCDSAGIDFQFCSCFEPHAYDKNGTLAKRVAEFVLDSVNGIVRNNSAESKCEVFKLASIDAFIQLSEGSHWTRIFKISLRTEPTAQFEAAVELRSENKLTLLSDIDRTDWFSSHAGCVKGSSFERYCYCKPASS